MRLVYLFAVCIGAAIVFSTAANEAIDKVAHEDRKPASENGVTRNFNGEKNGPKRHKRQMWRNHYATKLGDSTVYYHFDDRINDTLKATFSSANKLWETGTCLTFKEQESSEGIFVTISPDETCYTDSDKINHNHTIYLGEFCTGIAGMAHEIGHALGFPHAQVRTDRDNYLFINTNNLKYYEEQYAKMSDSEEVSYNMPYDYGSIMQYSYDSAMIPKDVNYNTTMGSPFVSFIDKVMVNRHYNCSAKCAHKPVLHCNFSGFADPKDCKKCVCPDGYGGDLCGERPSDCGVEVWAPRNGSERTLTKSINNAGSSDEYKTCTTWIRAESNTRIVIKLVSISGGPQESIGCDMAGVEIKTKDDQTLTGYRFCSDTDSNIILESNLTLIPIIYYSKESTDMIVTLNYYSVANWVKRTSGDNSQSQ
ncbi:astacin [Ancylostoma caninum]|uniref:Zinc metalloproteinase n=1 Tax=Ancylostoma caninum TaxID=29170 RepID=A0A368GZT9_ANCCA|nr:astacin [Ancylostoma caninum]